MADERQDRNAADGARDSRDENDAALQEELRREASEGKDLIGDTGRDRNVSGSSSWVTLPEEEKSSGSDGERGGGAER